MDDYNLNKNEMKNYINYFSQIQDFDEQVELLSGDELRSYFSGNECKSVLLVEDDYLQVDIIEELISEINPNVEVDWECDVASAVRRITTAPNTFRQSKYDLVISDVVLGDHSSGMELYEFCHEYEPKTKFMLISAHTREELRDKHFKKTEPVQYFKKPINYRSFIEALKPVLSA